MHIYLYIQSQKSPSILGLGKILNCYFKGNNHPISLSYLEVKGNAYEKQNTSIPIMASTIFSWQRRSAWPGACKRKAGSWARWAKPSNPIRRWPTSAATCWGFITMTLSNATTSFCPTLTSSHWKVSATPLRSSMFCKDRHHPLPRFCRASPMKPA